MPAKADIQGLLLTRLDPLPLRLAKNENDTRANARQFQLAEGWRTRLLEQGKPACAAFVDEVGALDPAGLSQLVVDAQNERDHGQAEWKDGGLA